MDAQDDLCLCCSYMAKTGFVMNLNICKFPKKYSHVTPPICRKHSFVLINVREKVWNSGKQV